MICYGIIGISFTFIHLIVPCSAVMTPQARLVRDLMADYNKFLRPVLDPSQLLNVNVLFSLKNIESLDEKNQVLTSFGFMAFSWVDELLRWDPKDYNGTTSIVLPGSEVWLPEIAMYNSVEKGDDLSMSVKYRAKAAFTGDVFWAPAFKWKTSCPVMLAAFPYDTQTCSITMVNWMYTKQEMQFTAVGILEDVYESNGAWTLINLTVAQDIMTTKGTNVQAPRLRYIIEIKRIAAYYELNVLVPCIMISFLSALVFYLPLESGEKVSLAITVSLSYTVILLMMSDISPKSGESMPLISVFIIMGMGQTFLFLFLTVVILNISHHRPDVAVPACLRSCVFGCLAKLLCMKCGSRDRRRVRPTKHNVNNGNNVNNMNLNDLDQQIMDKAKTLAAPPGALLPDDVLTYLRDKIDDDQETQTLDKNRREWRSVAKVLDRFFLVFFLIVIVVDSTFFIIITKTGLAVDISEMFAKTMTGTQ